VKRVPVHPLAEQLLGRSLDVAEFDERLRLALADEERMNDLVELIAWFRSRYPSVEERLGYARRKYAQIARGAG
jgi:hypothetical protein